MGLVQSFFYPVIPGSLCPQSCSSPIFPLSLYPGSYVTPLSHYPVTPEDSLCESS